MIPALVVSVVLMFGEPTPGPSASPASASATPSPVPTLPAPAPSPTAATIWLGVTLGEAPKDVRTQLGKPRQIVSSSIGDVWRYDTENGNVTMELVVAQDAVINIAARLKTGKQSTLTDPLGGALGMSLQALQSVRGTPLAVYDGGASVAYGEAAGVRWFYSIDNGVVTSIEVSEPLPPPPPGTIVSDKTHDGSSVAKAFQVKASSAAASTAAELAFLGALTCDNGGQWQVSGSQVVASGGRFYDLYQVTCSTTNAARDFYFDVTDTTAQ